MEQEMICRLLLQKIIACELPPGSFFPAEPELAKQLNTSRMKVHRALNVLRRGGVAASRPHCGTMVVPLTDLLPAKQLLAFFLRKVAVMYASPPDNIHWQMSALETLKNELERYGFETAFYPFRDRSRKMPSNFSEVLGSISENEFGSVVLLPTHSRQITEHAALLRSKSFRFFLLNYSGLSALFRIPRMHQVIYDHYADGFFLGDLLGRSGCRNVILLSSRSVMSWSLDRCEGTCDGLHQHFPDLKVAMVPSSVRGVGVLRDFIRRKGPETVVVTAHCDYAVSTDNILQRENLLCGRDYKLITFADNSGYADRKYTALALPGNRAGAELAALVSKTQGKTQFTERLAVMLTSELVVRNSFIPGAGSENICAK